MTPKLKPWTVGFVFSLLFTATGHTQTTTSSDSFSQRFKNLGFHLGTLTEFYNAVQIDNKGTQEKFGFNPLIGFSTDVQMIEDLHFIPEIFWVLPREAGTGVSQNLFMLRGDVAWRGADYWRLRLGSSLMVNNIRGEGGSDQMNNGNGTSKFYIPAESRTSMNTTLDFGAEAMVEDFGLRFQTYIYSVLKAERRQISYTLTFTYYYDLGK